MIYIMASFAVSMKRHFLTSPVLFAKLYIWILSHPWGTYGNVCKLDFNCWKAHGRFPISDKWTSFSGPYGWGTTSENLSKSGLSKWVYHFDQSLTWKVMFLTNYCLHQKTGWIALLNGYQNMSRLFHLSECRMINRQNFYPETWTCTLKCGNRQTLRMTWDM